MDNYDVKDKDQQKHRFSWQPQQPYSPRSAINGINNFDNNANESTSRYGQIYSPNNPPKVPEDYWEMEHRVGVSSQPFCGPTYDTPLSGYPTSTTPTKTACATGRRIVWNTLPGNITNTLRGWLQNNLDNPYPTNDDKESLMRETNLTTAQINNWFMNARRRDPRLRSTRNRNQTPRRRLRARQNASKSKPTSKYEDRGTMTDQR